MAQTAAATTTSGATISWKIKLLAAAAIAVAILVCVFSHNPRNSKSNSIHYVKSYPVPDAGLRPEQSIFQGTPGGVHYQSKTPVGPLSEEHPAAGKPSFRAAIKFAEQQLIVEKLLAQEGSLVQGGQPILLVKVGDHTEIVKAASTGVLQYLITGSPGGAVAKDSPLFSLGHPEVLPMSPVFTTLLICGVMLLLGGLGAWCWASSMRSLPVAEHEDDCERHIARQSADGNAQQASGCVWAAPPKAPSASAHISPGLRPLATVREDSIPLLSSNFRPLEPAEAPHTTEVLKREVSETSTVALSSRTWDREVSEAHTWERGISSEAQ